MKMGLWLEGALALAALWACWRIREFAQAQVKLNADLVTLAADQRPKQEAWVKISQRLSMGFVWAALLLNLAISHFHLWMLQHPTKRELVFGLGLLCFGVSFGMNVTLLVAKRWPPYKTDRNRI